MEIVVNSWFPYYFRPNESLEKQALLARFLQRFTERNDTLVILGEGEMNRKLGETGKQIQRFPAHLYIFKKFMREIYIVPEKCRIVSGDVELPNNILEVIHRDGTNFNSDKFLFVTASHTEDKIIVTTDNRLINNGLNSILNEIDFKVHVLEDFLKEY